MGNIVSDYRKMELVTPSRLTLGRNNEKNPVSPISRAGNLSEIVKISKRTFNTWFETWLVSHA